MKKPEIVAQWARESGVSRAEAADRLDGAVCLILGRLRRACEAPLPGVGKFRRGTDRKLTFEPDRNVR